MDIQTLTSFFLCCVILNGALLILWTVMCLAAPDLVYRTQNRWFPLPRETFNIIIYSSLGLFKLLFLMFNVAPYIALLIVG